MAPDPASTSDRGFAPRQSAVPPNDAQPVQAAAAVLVSRRAGREKPRSFGEARSGRSMGRAPARALLARAKARRLAPAAAKVGGWWSTRPGRRLEPRSRRRCRRRAIGSRAVRFFVLRLASLSQPPRAAVRPVAALARSAVAVASAHPAPRADPALLPELVSATTGFPSPSPHPGSRPRPCRSQKLPSKAMSVDYGIVGPQNLPAIQRSMVVVYAPKSVKAHTRPGRLRTIWKPILRAAPNLTPSRFAV